MVALAISRLERGQAQVLLLGRFQHMIEIAGTSVYEPGPGIFQPVRCAHSSARAMASRTNGLLASV